MGYLFGDSVKFPLKRDFLGLLDDYIDTAVETIARENDVFESKEDIMDRRRLKNSVLAEMNTFLNTVKNAISEAVGKSKEQEAIEQYAQRSNDFLNNFIEDGTKNFSDEIFQEIAQFEGEIDQADELNRQKLESFLMQDPIPIINKKYTLKMMKKGYSSIVQNDSMENISYVFKIESSESPFWKDVVKASNFQKGVKIPGRMKKPLLKKEMEPDIIEIDDYLLSSLVLSGKELEAVFRKSRDIDAERFRLKMDYTDEFTVEAYYAAHKGVEKSIKGVPELKRVFNPPKLCDFGQKIAQKTEEIYEESKLLESLNFKGRDVFEENLIFDLMQEIAEIFAPTVAEIKQHSPSKGELSLKLETKSGERNELYLEKSQIKEKLKNIGDKGDRLLSLLNIE